MTKLETESLEQPILKIGELAKQTGVAVGTLRYYESLGLLEPALRSSSGYRYYTVDLLQKKYVLSLKVCSSLGQTLNYWVDWHLLKLAQPARL